jgi:hypothetical protein
MRYLFSPQRSENRITYAFNGDIITATYEVLDLVTVIDAEGNQTQERQVVETHTDTFDFSALPDGESGEIVTTLPVNPIVRAARVAGVLELELLNFVGPNATESERFPEWKVIA